MAGPDNVSDRSDFGNFSLPDINSDGTARRGASPSVNSKSSTSTVPLFPSSRFTQSRTRSVSTASILSSGGAGPNAGAVRPPGVNPEDTYMLNVSDPTDARGQKNFMQMVKSMTNMNQQIMDMLNKMCYEQLQIPSVVKVS
jgi:hypothetical protein